MGDSCTNSRGGIGSKDSSSGISSGGSDSNNSGSCGGS